MDEHRIRGGSVDMGLLWPLLRRAAVWPAMVAVAAFISFLYLPDLWVALTAWHLYLDRLHPIFIPATQFAARAAMGGMAALALFWVLTFLTLLLTRSRSRSCYLAVEHAAAVSRWELSRVDDDVLNELSASYIASTPASAEPMVTAEPDMPTRNRWDQHPDDAPRAPLSAERDLPAGGLAAMAAEPPPATPTAAATAAKLAQAPIAEPAPDAPSPRINDDPWLLPVERSGPPSPAAHDVSLSALVMRLEARLARRRRPLGQEAPPEPPADIPKPETPPMTVSDHSIDLALEAALRTLQRMNMRAVG